MKKEEKNSWRFFEVKRNKKEKFPANNVTKRSLKCVIKIYLKKIKINKKKSLNKIEVRILNKNWIYHI